MNNLKRVLSLVMSGAMLVGMLTVGASAANTTFTDKDEITHTEAVNTMAALGVIKGKDTGAYDPKGNVTRAEMAKIICVMLNGGEEPAWGTDVKTTFTDSQTHWARNYIAYCANKGIIAGQGDGTFNPDGNVTGAQAAKMMLVALNYDPDIFHLVGAKWEDNTNDLAGATKLYKDIKGLDTSAALNRDDAAQMAYNCLDAKPMVKSFESIAANGEITYKYNEGNEDFLGKYFEAVKFVGTFEGNKEMGVTSKDGYIRVNGKLEGATGNASAKDFPAELDASNVGEEVKVIFRDKNNNDYPDNYDEIYGVYNTGATEVLNVLAGDVEDPDDGAKIKIDGTKYTVKNTSGTPDSFDVNFNYNDSDAKKDTGNTSVADIVSAVTAGSKVDSVKFILKDGEVVSAWVVENKISRVVSANSTKVSLLGEKVFEIKDNDVYEGIAKDDIVVYNKLYKSTADKATMIVKKAEAVEGKLEGFKKDSAGTALTRVTIDGTNYDVVDLKSTLTDDTEDHDAIIDGDIALDDTVKVYLVEGKVLALEGIDTDGDSQYALIIGSNGEQLSGDAFDVAQVKVVLADGTEKIFTLHKDSFNATNASDHGLTSATATLTFNSGASLLVKYVMKGEKMKITAFATEGANAIGISANVWDEDSLKLAYSNGTSDKAVASTNAKLFVKSGTDTYKVHNLRSLGSFKMSGADGKVQYFTNGSGQITYAFLARDNQPGSRAQDSIYGIVSAANGTHKVGDDTYYYFTVNDGENEYEVNLDATDADSLNKGDVITFKEKADKIYDATDITALTKYNKTDKDYDVESVDGWSTVAVDSYKDNILSYFAATNVVAGETDVYEGTDDAASVAVKSDVEIRYISADPDEVGAGVANDVTGFDVNTGYANAMYHVDEKGVVDVIIVETSGEISLSNAFPTA